MFDQDARNPLLASTANNGKFVTNPHLKHATIGQAKRRQIIHYFLGKLDRGFRIARAIGRGRVNLSTMRRRTTRVNMKTHKSLRALLYASLNAVQKIVAAIRSTLPSRHHDLKTISLQLGLTGNSNLPSKIRLALPITLSAGINAAMTRIKSNNIRTVHSSIGKRERLLPI